MIYQMAYSGGTIGLITQQLKSPNPINFAPIYHGLARVNAGTGPRLRLRCQLDDQRVNAHHLEPGVNHCTKFCTRPRVARACPIRAHLGRLSGDSNTGDGSDRFSGAARPDGKPDRHGLASDATAWIIVPVAGSYQLAYGDGTNEVLQNVTALAPPPFP